MLIRNISYPCDKLKGRFKKYIRSACSNSAASAGHGTDLLGRRVQSFSLVVRYLRNNSPRRKFVRFKFFVLLVFGIYMVFQWYVVYQGIPMVNQTQKMKYHWYGTSLTVPVQCGTVLYGTVPKDYTVRNLVSSGHLVDMSRIFCTSQLSRALYGPVRNGTVPVRIPVA